MARFRILSLDGGGIRGLISAMLLIPVGTGPRFVTSIDLSVTHVSEVTLEWIGSATFTKILQLDALLLLGFFDEGQSWGAIF